jgi:hypothetical protein
VTVRRRTRCVIVGDNDPRLALRLSVNGDGELIDHRELAFSLRQTSRRSMTSRRWRSAVKTNKEAGEPLTAAGKAVLLRLHDLSRCS